MVRRIRSVAVLVLIAGSLVGCDWITNASHACQYGAREPAMSGTGRYVVFSAVCVGDPVTGGALSGVGVGSLGQAVSQLFVRDLRDDVTTGVTYATGGGASTNTAVQPVVSDDGRYVVFASPASDLVAGDTNGTSDVFVRDTVQGTTTRLSETSTGVQGNAASDRPAIAADGHTVSFVSRATNLVPNGPAGGGIYVEDIATRAISLPYPIASTSDSVAGGISGDGLHLLENRFHLGAQTGIYVRDLGTATDSPRVDLDRTGGPPNGESTSPGISGDGRFVTWTTSAEDVVGGDARGSLDVFVRDLQAGTTRRVSAPLTGQSGSKDAQGSRISRNGRFVAFWATDPDGSGDPDQCYVTEVTTGTLWTASATANGTPSDGICVNPAISGDGRYVAFASDAKNLDDNDDGVTDVYVRFVIRPVVTSATPSSITRGATTTVTLHGSGFLNGATVAVSGAGLNVGATTVVDSRTLTVSITAAPDAPTGARDVTPTNPGTGPGTDRGSTGRACAGCLTVAA